MRTWVSKYFLKISLFGFCLGVVFSEKANFGIVNFLYETTYWNSGLISFIGLIGQIGTIILIPALMYLYATYFNTSNDIVYSHINVVRKSEYQDLFEKILLKTDVLNETERSLGNDYDKERSNQDWEFQIGLVENFEKQTGLKGIIIQTMLEQYFFADIHQRELDKKNWINRVLERRKEDYFPDSKFIYYQVMGR